MLWILIIQAFWLIAPAYAANAFPPLLKGRKPLDFGRIFFKHRILGDGKTFEGTMAGILFGVFIGSIQIFWQGYIPNEWGLNLIKMTFLLVMLLSVGAVFGDIVGAFIKRRLGIPRGNSAPLLDQLDFIFGAVLLSGLVINVDFYIILTLIILTPPIHLIANLIGYAARVKRTPW